MISSGVPAKFNIPFANNAGGAYVRNIPEASQVGITPGAASLYDGFPPLTFTPLTSGGVPPAGADFNGLLRQITRWIQWLNAGAPIFWDSAFATAIGGYPKGAFISATGGLTFWLSSVEANTSNPDAGGAGWISVVPPAAATVAPLMDGVAAVGSSLLFARQDHVHPVDTSRAALSYVNSTFLTIAVAAATYLTKANPTSSGTFIHNGSQLVNGDITASRPASPTTGVIFLGNAGNRYLYYDGTNYVMPGAELFVNGQSVVAGITNAYQTAVNASSAAAAAQGTANTALSNANTAQATANNLANQAFGSGQSWQDVISIRGFSTNFTNSTARPIFVSIVCTSVNGARAANAYVNGAFAGQATSVSNTGVGNLNFIVPAGATYSVQTPGFLNINVWLELR